MIGLNSLASRTNEDIEINGFDIPKRTNILTVLWAFHHDPKYWKDPDTFEPTRFLSGDGKTIDEPKAFIPFSYGKYAQTVFLAHSVLKFE